MKNIFLGIWDFVKALFNRSLNKDRFSVDDIHSVCDTLLGYLDADKNGMISYRELLKMIRDLFKNLRNLRGGSNA